MDFINHQVTLSSTMGQYHCNIGFAGCIEAIKNHGMLELKKAHEQRGQLLKDSKALVDTARRENRNINASEDGQLSSNRTRIFELDCEITRLQNGLSNSTETRSHGDLPLGDYSLTRAIRAAGNGRLDGLELEMSQELERRSGIAPNGFLVPADLLANNGRERRAMSVSGDAGIYGSDFVATEKRGFVDALRPLLACAQAGALILDGLSSDVDIPRQVAASTASWKTEIADLGEATPEITQLELRPRRVGAYTVFSKRLLAQSSTDIEAMVRMDLLSACAVALDKAAISGGGTNEPVGILSTVGIGDVAGGTNGALPTWAHIVQLIAKLEGANAMGGKTAFLINSATAAKLRSTPKVTSTDSRMILEGNDLLGHPVFVTNQVPSGLTKGSASGICSAIICGDFQNLVLGSFGNALDLVIDPFSKAVKGQTQIVVNSYVDAGVRQPGAFAAMLDALTA